MKTWGIIFTMMTMVLLSCNKKEGEVNGYQIFTIKQGSHQSNHNDFEDVINDTILKFNVIFDSSAMYHTISQQNDEDINKLYGMSDCGIMHHMNSARIGWRWLNNALQLFAYSYSNGKREVSPIGSFQISKELRCSIICTKGKYLFQVNDKKTETNRSCSINEHYLLYPYFGGNEVAPHNIIIKIAHLNKK